MLNIYPLQCVWLVWESAQPLRTSFQHTHSLFLEGGTDVGRPEAGRSLRYQINLNGNFSDGVMKGSLRNTYGGGAKLIYDTRKLQITSDLQVEFTNTQDSPYGSFSTFRYILPVLNLSSGSRTATANSSRRFRRPTSPSMTTIPGPTSVRRSSVRRSIPSMKPNT